MQFDVSINATLELDEDEWEQLVFECADNEGLNVHNDGEVCEADRDEAEDAARQYLESELEGIDLDTTYGRAWACSVDLSPM